MRVFRSLGLLAIVSAVCWCPASAMGGPEAAGFASYKFTNTTGQTAYDLHIVFDQPVTWTGTCPPQTPANTFTSCTGKGTTTVRLAGGSVNSGAALSITLPYDVRPAKILYWYWTNANGRPIRVYNPERLIANLDRVKSGGQTEGQITISNCCETPPLVFTTLETESEQQMASRLVTAIQDHFTFDVAYVDETNNTKVVFVGGCFGDEATCLRDIVIDQEPSYGDLTVRRERTPIPAVSEWGLAALTLLVLAAGTVVLMRRRAAAAA